MIIKKSLITVLSLLLLFVFMQCMKENPTTVVSSEDVSQIWSEAAVIDYLAKMQYPEKRADYKRQFFDGVHRSQLSEEEILEKSKNVLHKPVGGYENYILASSVYFYFTHEDSRDEDVYEDANGIFGDMVFEYPDTHWDTNTDYMTVTADVWECYEYLTEYATYSDFSYPSSSSSSYSNASTTLSGSAYLLLSGYYKPVSPIEINAVTPSYVFANLNPGFETWASGRPSAWCISLLSPYNVPSTWNSYFSTATATQSSNEYSGTYAVAISANRNVGKSLASGYFQLADGADNGVYYAGIAFGGNTQNLTFVLEIALYGTDDALLGSSSGNLATGSAGAYLVQEVSYNTGATVPKYVRFNVRQLIGQNTNVVYVDALYLKGPTGDISLPVEFTGITYSDYVSSRKIRVKWTTESEIENSGWKLFFDVSGTPTEVCTTLVSGMGSYPAQTNYDYTFYMHSTQAWNQIRADYGIDVFLGARDFDGTWTYYDDDDVVWVVYP